MKKVELPSFEGGNPIGWISRAENCFEVQEVSPREHIKLPFITMEGGANHWFRFWRKKIKNPSWEGLMEALIKRFGVRDRALVFEKSAVVREEGEVKGVSSDERPAERTTTRSNLYQQLEVTWVVLELEFKPNSTL